MATTPIQQSSHTPRPVWGVMVSSTFTDLEAHRTVLIESLRASRLFSEAMENDGARLDDVIASSLEKVRDGAAYIGLISMKYGQTPVCANRNPEQLSITELEFNEAQRLGRPILLFVMGDEHPGKRGDFESDPAKQAKLDAFRERAKKHLPDGQVDRVYAEFNSLKAFKEKVQKSLPRLARYLEEHPPQLAQASGSQPADSALADNTAPPPASPPRPPTFHAEPAYIPGQKFQGRSAQLEQLNDWAQPANQHPVLLFDAIGGSGKSHLTWQWVNQEATKARADWAGRFWFSFYERGTQMAGFCRHALAYMRGQPVETFQKQRTPELARELLLELRAKPWLLVLDGLERVLVNYQRHDAAQLRDEDANTPTDALALNRPPCAAAEPDDDELLRQLAAAGPSKLLVSSRLVPQVWLNPALQAVPGVLRQPLAGLRPAEAEALMRANGVSGRSESIQAYVQEHCDGHPLTCGVLAGLVAKYLPARGNFDAWAADTGPQGGARLNLGALNLVQKRNHILSFALEALPPPGRQLLGSLALISEAVDYEALLALNPHLPAAPQEVGVPQRPEDHWVWAMLDEEKKAERREAFATQQAARQAYEQALADWHASAAVGEAPQHLAATVEDLEQRGLLNYDRRAQHYDLHPVVRSVALAGLNAQATQDLGQAVVDHFASRPHSPWEDAQSLDDVKDGLQVVSTLLRMGRWEPAYDAYAGDLSNALFFNLQAPGAVLALLRPFFPGGWGEPLADLAPGQRSYLANNAGLALSDVGDAEAAGLAYGCALRLNLAAQDRLALRVRLSNLAAWLSNQGRRARAALLWRWELRLAQGMNDADAIFSARLDVFADAVLCCDEAAAQALWPLLADAPRPQNRAIYRAGEAEYWRASGRFTQGQLDAAELADMLALVRTGKSRSGIRDALRLQARWNAGQARWPEAEAAYQEAATLARQSGLSDSEAELGRLLARLKQDPGSAEQARAEAERWEVDPKRATLSLAELWLALGEPAKAREQALTAYRKAWSEGEPYVYRYWLDQARALLIQLGAAPPDLPPYDQAKDPPLPWEAEVLAAIERWEAEDAAKAAKKAAQEAALDAGEDAGKGAGKDSESEREVRAARVRHSQRPDV